MAYSIEFTPAAQRQFKKLDRNTRRRIGRRIDALADNKRRFLTAHSGRAGFDDGHSGLRVTGAGSEFVEHLRQFFAIGLVFRLNQVQVAVSIAGVEGRDGIAHQPCAKVGGVTGGQVKIGNF